MSETDLVSKVYRCIAREWKKSRRVCSRLVLPKRQLRKRGRIEERNKIRGVVNSVKLRRIQCKQIMYGVLPSRSLSFPYRQKNNEAELWILIRIIHYP